MKHCKHHLTPVVAGLILAAILSPFAPQSHAQAWPAKPLRIISPYPPGGGNDTVARILSPSLSTRFGQQIVVENRPGANTILGTEFTAKSAPDGYTVVLLPNAFAINPHLYKKLPFDPVKDFAPLTLVGTSPLILTVHPSLPARNVKDFIALARARPGQIAHGSSGNGSLGHLAGALLDVMTGTKLLHIPYKGTALAITELIGGQITASFASAAGVLQHIRSGRLKALAVTSATRSPALPDMPTIAETLPGYSAELWYGLLAPANTPAEVVARWNRELVAVVAQNDIKEKLAAQGIDAISNTPQEFARLIAADLEKWGKVVKLTGLRQE